MGCLGLNLKLKFCFSLKVMRSCLELFTCRLFLQNGFGEAGQAQL